MASKEQEALNIVNNFVEWNDIKGLEVKYPFDYDYELVSKSIDKLQEAIHELKLYKKVVEKLLDHMEQNGIVCLYSGCPKQEFDISNQICVGSDCPTREEIKEFILDEVRKELENEN